MLSFWLQKAENLKYLTYSFLTCVGVLGLCLSILIDNQSRFKLLLKFLKEVYFSLSILLIFLWFLGFISGWWCLIFLFISALEWINMVIPPKKAST